MKQFASSSKKWLLLTDLHLNRDTSWDSKVVQNIRKAGPGYGVIVMGDFLDYNMTFAEAFMIHRELFEVLSQRNTIFLKGNCDPKVFSSYRAVIIYLESFNITIKHGHIFSNSFMNFLKKPRKLIVNKSSTFRYKKIKKINKKNNLIIGHYHFEYINPIKKVAILSPRKVYRLEEVLDV